MSPISPISRSKSKQSILVMPSPLEDPDHWHRRAKEARDLAEGMSDSASKRLILRIAEGYENLAVRATQRLAGPGGSASKKSPRRIERG